jgi:hypothetical protein
MNYVCVCVCVVVKSLEDMKVRNIYKTACLPFVLYEREIWPLTLRENTD